MDVIRKCPKCRQTPYKYTEFWKDHTIEFDVEQGFISDEGYMEPGVPCYVQAECWCGYKWRLRNVIQIEDLRECSNLDRQIEGGK